MKVGDKVILKGQRPGRFHLEGGYIVEINAGAAVIACDTKMFAWPMEDLEPLSTEHMTKRGVELVAVEGAPYVSRPQKIKESENANR
jgi:hypothetical protein